MAVTIAEPNDVEAGSLDDNNAILVYQQSSMGAGIRKLALADWRDYLGYNGQKVNNLESYTGMDSSYAWDDPNNTTPYTDDASKVDLTNRIERLSEKSGISYAQPWDGGSTHESRISQLETDTSNLRTDLGTKPSGFNDAFVEISNLKTEIGSYTPGGTTVTDRIQNLENTVDGPLNQPELGLKGIVNGFDSGDPSTHTIGLKEYVRDGYDVDEGGTTVHKPSLNEIVVNGYTEGGTPVNGLQTRVSSLESDVQGNMSATPNPVLGLKREVEGYEQSGSHVNGLLDNVEDLQHKMDGWTEGSTNHPSLYTSTLGNNGNDWVGQSGSIAAQVKTNTTDIANIKQELGSVYKVMGDVYGANGSSGQPTTSINITDDVPPVTKNLSELQNGWVYNVMADPLTIYTSNGSKMYTKGTNIVWIKNPEDPSDNGHFDELGAVIDVGAIEQEIDDVRTDVTTLKNKSGNSTSTSWTSGTLTGTYMFNARITISGTMRLYVFIACLSNGQIYAMPDSTNKVVNLSGNFTEGFSFDTNNRIRVVSTANAADISWTKIS